MAKQKENKTNAMRILETLGIEFIHHTYECKNFESGIQIADMLGLDHEKVYKTLVTKSQNNSYYVFVIPIEEEIDFKKAAKVVHEKSLEMIHVKDINQITGYIRGGCTAVGMKKNYPTIIQEDAMLLDTIIVSGGKIGSQLELKPDDLKLASNAEYADVIK